MDSLADSLKTRLTKKFSLSTSTEPNQEAEDEDFDARRKEVLNKARQHMFSVKQQLDEESKQSFVASVHSTTQAKKLNISPLNPKYKIFEWLLLWSIDDVCRWLNSTGFKEFIPIMKENSVNGLSLVYIDSLVLRFFILIFLSSFLNLFLLLSSLTNSFVFLIFEFRN